MSSSEEEHTCPICLEPIFQPPSSDTDEGSNNRFNIGATVPCGHLYHYDCFGSWQAAKSYGAVKCPTCNVKTDDFVRLFLDVASLGGGQCHLAEDDDISLSSIEDDKHGEDNENRNEGDTEESKEEQDSTHEQDDENDKDVVDLTKSPQRPKSQPLHPSNPTNDDNDDNPQRQGQLKRLSRIAKKFKKQYLQKSAQYKEQYTEKRKLSDRIRQAEGDLKGIEEKMTEIERDRELMELKLNESRLDLIRIQQERDNLKSRYSTMVTEKSRAETNLQACHSFYKKELETARTKTMSEVQEIMTEHPKVVEENRVLKQKLQKLQRSLSRGSSSSSSNSNGIDTSSRGHSKAKDINKALRQMDQLVRSRQNTATPKTLVAARNGSNLLAGSGSKNRSNQGGGQSSLEQARALQARALNKSRSTILPGRTPSMRVNSGQYSSLASRMMKASEKAKRPPQGKKRSSIESLSLPSQNKRMKSFSASRRDLFQRKP